MSSTGISKTSAQLFRDCLRLISHISGKTSKKTLNIKRIVKAEFRKNGWEKDTSRVDTLKSNAIRGLANYLMLESMQKDKRLKDRTSKYTKSEADSLKKQ